MTETWKYAVQTVSRTISAHGHAEGQRRAMNWERNCGFDAAKLYKEAQQEETEPSLCLAKAYGGDWCKTFCMMPKDCSALPESDAA